LSDWMVTADLTDSLVLCLFLLKKDDVDIFCLAKLHN
jgi:hypothetical protein